MTKSGFTKRTLIEAVDSGIVNGESTNYVIINLPPSRSDEENYLDLEIMSGGSRRAIEHGLVDGCNTIFSDMYQEHRLHPSRPFVARLGGILKAHALTLVFGMVLGALIAQVMT